MAELIYDENGRLMNGADIITAAALIESLGADGLGLNCGFGPDKMLEFDYAPTEIGVFDGTEYYINLDMNRK